MSCNERQHIHKINCISCIIHVVHETALKVTQVANDFAISRIYRVDSLMREQLRESNELFIYRNVI